MNIPIIDHSITYIPVWSKFKHWGWKYSIISVWEWIPEDSIEKKWFIKELSHLDWDRDDA